ncbi:MAG: DUF1924 domain-containing protein [Magnetococcales bacterium]|nr:DUF1924 domain-containing protein [Magnetococcales bacterium]
MKHRGIRILALGAVFLLSWTSEGRAGAFEDLMEDYKQQGGGPVFSSIAGEGFWRTIRGDAKDKCETSCTACHTTDLTRSGTHCHTGKPIEPMAPSVKPDRYADAEKVEKWFRRNCREVVGRECTPQEKGDVLSFLKQQ